MTKTNKTSEKITCRFLSDGDFEELYQANIEAFSDYQVPFELSRTKFKNHLAQNAVDLDLSVGAFANGRMIGFTLNGFGSWDEKHTAYDAGTAVVPQYRHQGIGRALFDFLFPKLREIGVEQMLLEVLEKNRAAIGLYEKLGFRKTRDLLFFEQKGERLETGENAEIEIREIERPDWPRLKSFWDGNTSWQYSSESIERKLLPKLILGAFLKDRIRGYGVVYPKTGAVVQLAVDKKHRRKKIASTLLAELGRRSEKGNKMNFSNVDRRLAAVTGFIEDAGFRQTFAQIEMIKPL